MRGVLTIDLTCEYVPHQIKVDQVGFEGIVMKHSTAGPFGAALLVSLWLAGCGGSLSTPPGPRGDAALVAANAATWRATCRPRRENARPCAPARAACRCSRRSARRGSAAPARRGDHHRAVGNHRAGARLDEDDLIKTDGSTFVTLAREAQLQIGKAWARVQLHGRRADGGVDALGSVDLPSDPQAYGVAHGLYHLPALQRVAVLSESQWPYTFDVCGGVAGCGAAQLLPGPPVFMKNSVWLDLVHTGTPSAPALASASHRRATARQPTHRQRVVLVTQHGATRGRGRSRRRAEHRARSADREDCRRRVLPQVIRGNAAPEPLLAETIACAAPAMRRWETRSRRSPCSTSSRPAPRAQPLLRRRQRGAVLSPAGLYLATTRFAYDRRAAGAGVLVPGVDRHPKFASRELDRLPRLGPGERSSRLGHGETSYRMSEHNGDLRVLTFSGATGWVGIANATAPTAPPPSPATLHVLRESAVAKRLDQVGRLPNAQRPTPWANPANRCTRCVSWATAATS